MARNNPLSARGTVATAPSAATPPEASHFDEIQAFVAVAQCESFTAAGHRLGKNASTVSRRIAALEARLGTRLVARTTRQVALTEAGATYLARMSGILEEIARTNAEIAAQADVPHGLLRLALPRTYGRLWIAPLLPRLLAKHPQLRVEAYYADHYVDLVAEGYDVAVRLGKLADSALVARRLAGVRRSLAASSAYLARHGTPERPQDLPDHRCLGFSGISHGATWVLRGRGESHEIPLAPVLVADDAETLVTAAAEGAGIVAVTDWLLRKHPDGRRLVPVLADWDVGEPGAIYVVTPTARFVPAKTTAFIDLLAEELRS